MTADRERQPSSQRDGADAVLGSRRVALRGIRSSRGRVLSGGAALVQPLLRALSDAYRHAHARRPAPRRGQTRARRRLWKRPLDTDSLPNCGPTRGRGRSCGMRPFALSANDRPALDRTPVRAMAMVSRQQSGAEHSRTAPSAPRSRAVSAYAPAAARSGLAAPRRRYGEAARAAHQPRARSRRQSDGSHRRK